jgi:hypothetical protein
MQAPPPYAAPAKKSNSKLIIGLVIGLICICCVLPIVGGGFFLNWIVNKGGPFITCVLAYQQVPAAIEEYAKENGGKLPPAEKWNDVIRPYYVKQTKGQREVMSMKFMDPNGEWGCPEVPNKTGMAYNLDVAGKKLADIKDKSTVLLFESTKTGRNLAAKYTPQPFEKSPFAFQTKERRGWIVVTVDSQMYFIDKDGKRIENSGSRFSAN